MRPLHSWSACQKTLKLEKGVKQFCFRTYFLSVCFETGRWKFNRHLGAREVFLKPSKYQSIPKSLILCLSYLQQFYIFSKCIVRCYYFCFTNVSWRNVVSKRTVILTNLHSSNFLLNWLVVDIQKLQTHCTGIFRKLRGIALPLKHFSYLASI